MRPRFIYFIAPIGGGPIKIGSSLRPMRRLTEINKWVPVPLELLVCVQGTFHMEAALHQRFAADWSHGEWFHPSDALLSLVAELKRGAPLVIDPVAQASGMGRHVAITEKKRWTRLVTKALLARGVPHGSLRGAPPHIAAIVNSYAGSANPPPSAEHQRILSDWCAAARQQAAA